jgi:hypothetical protein
MRRYVFRWAVLTGMLLAPALSLGNDNPGNDKQIAETIVQKLQQEKKTGSLKGFSLDLQVEEGTVWLSGRVSSPEQQARALDIARRVSGVKQVVNDITVSTANETPAKFASGSPSQSQNMLASMNLPAEPTAAPAAPRAATPMLSAVSQHPASTILTGRSEIGSGITPSTSPTAPGVQQIASRPGPTHPLMTNPGYGYGPTQSPALAHQSQVPMAYAPAHYVNSEAMGGHRHHGGYGGGGPVYGDGPSYSEGGGGGPVPMHTGGGMGMAPARYDHPSMPGHAWPSYAAYPNYAAVTYPKQYSPTAWPYIGPFYPYPQVPLGWRKVTMEWDDGWWMLDFKNRRYR